MRCTVYTRHSAKRQTHSLARSFVRSFFPSLESELTSQPQSTAIEKACKYWAKYGREKEMGRSVRRARARKKSAKYSEEYWAYTHTHSRSRDDGKTDKERRTESWKRCARSNSEENDKHCISSSNTQTQTHINTLQISAEQLWKSYLYWIWLVFALGEPTADLK